MVSGLSGRSAAPTIAANTAVAIARDEAGTLGWARATEAAVVDGRLGKALLFEAARVAAPKCRVVVVEADDSAPAVLEEAGLTVMAHEAGTVVAARG